SHSHAAFSALSVMWVQSSCLRHAGSHSGTAAAFVHSGHTSAFVSGAVSQPPQTSPKPTAKKITRSRRAVPRANHISHTAGLRMSRIATGVNAAAPKRSARMSPNISVAAIAYRSYHGRSPGGIAASGRSLASAPAGEADDVAAGLAHGHFVGAIEGAAA